MTKILVIGGATLDTIINYEEMETLVHQRHQFEQSYLLLEEGKKIEVTEQHCFSGGGATNAAVSFKQLGLETALFCKVGKDAAGTMIVEEMQRYGIDTANILYSDSAGTATSYVVPSLKGDRTIFAYRGANTTLMTKELPSAPFEQCDAVYITSLSKAAAERLPDIVALAGQHQIPVAINPGSSQLRRGSGFLKTALGGIHTLILNLEEAQQLMASLLDDDKALRDSVRDEMQSHPEGALLGITAQYRDVCFNLRQFFQSVLQLGPKIVVVTNGGEGVYVATEEGLYFHRAQCQQVVNTLGAGDAFGSSFVAAMQLGQSLEDAIRWGIVNSASVIQHPDAKSGLLNGRDIQTEIATLEQDAIIKKTW